MALPRSLLYEYTQFKLGNNGYEKSYSINHCGAGPPRAR
jgi:hypothetical protein